MGVKKVRVFDIDSGDLLYTMETDAEGKVILTEHPGGMPTLNEGMPEDFFDEMESWAELITKAVRHRGKIYTAADGDAYLQALCDEQPSNIVGYLRIL